MTEFRDARITAVGNSAIRVELDDPIGEPESRRFVSKIERLPTHHPSGWPVVIYDQDGEIRLELVATFVFREGAFIGDSDRRNR